MRGGVVDEAVGEHGDEDAAGGVVEAGGREGAVGERAGCQLDSTGAESGEVHARLGGSDLVGAGPEVGDGVALEAEAVLDVVEESGALGGEGAVDLRVGHHHRGGGRGGDDAAEGRLVGLVQGAVGHQGVCKEAVDLLGVGGEVLDGGGDLAALHTRGERRAEAAGEQGVLAEALGLAAEVPGAGEVDRGAEEVVVPLGASFGTDGDADAAGQVLVEGGGLGERHGEGGDVLLVPQTGGGVDHGEGRDAEVSESAEVAPDERLLLRGRHPCENGVDAVEDVGIGGGDGLNGGSRGHGGDCCCNDGGRQEGASVHGDSPDGGGGGRGPRNRMLHIRQ